ncbi:hypothetical protein BDV29DRAFT_162709 [Aspergillus leporis]|uniref:BL00235/CARNS1 N-terminal domain-containing protein n=1 Tax=Aspergillus leporis TaxID=41062 RepID=A0A5N5WLA9_9EURO|nr:hypothetical protein BDV29DRAFT_162709 [Aspergillus leporis]
MSFTATLQARNVPGVSVREALNQVRMAIGNRLSFRRLLLEPVQPRRLAMVEVRPDHKSIETIYDLGIQLIVLDQPGHWLEPDDGPYAHLREALVPFDTNIYAHFGDRLTRTLEALRADGVITRNDRMVTAVAGVAQAFGFSTSPAAAFEKPRISMPRDYPRSSAASPYAFRGPQISKRSCARPMGTSQFGCSIRWW